MNAPKQSKVSQSELVRGGSPHPPRTFGVRRGGCGDPPRETYVGPRRALCLVVLAMGVLTLSARGAEEAPLPAAKAPPVPFYARHHMLMTPDDVVMPWAPYKTRYLRVVRGLPAAQQEVLRRMHQRLTWEFPFTLDVTAGFEEPRVVYVEAGSGWFLRDENVWLFNRLPDLEYVNLFFSPVKSVGLLSLDGPQFRSLCLDAGSDGDISAIAMQGNLPELRHLELTARGQELTTSVFRTLTEFKKLQSLHLLGPEVTDEWLKWLKDHAAPGGKLPDRQYLQDHPEEQELWRTRTTLPHQLQGFGLKYTAVTDDGLALLAILPNLTHLALAGGRITAKGLAHLKALPKLEELHLCGPEFGDAALEPLKDLPNLRVLVLDHSKVTDGGMKTIAAMEKLEFLSVVATKVTPAAAERWRQVNPKMRKVLLKHPVDTDDLQGWIQGLEGLWDYMPTYRWVNKSGWWKEEGAAPAPPPSQTPPQP
jgi:hypothetical protein